WLRFDAQDANAYLAVADRTGTATSLAFAAAPVSGESGLDPRLMLDALTTAAASVDEVGPETVRGERTTRYRIDIDERKLFEQAQSGSQTSGTSGTMPDLGTTVFPAMTADAWIDAAGLVRRLQLRQDRSVVVDPATSGSAIGGLSQPYTVTTEFFDYG